MTKWKPLLTVDQSFSANPKGSAEKFKLHINDLLGVGGVQTVPDNPKGTRSKSVENRCKGRGEWNVYDIVCVDGVVKLSVKGKFVNGLSHSSQKKGYICLEPEGAPIHFQNLMIIELPSGVAPELR